METKDYVKIFRLDQENFQFNRGEFMNKMGEDRLKSLDEELASKKQAQRLKTESAKKEYDAKGTGYRLISIAGESYYRNYKIREIEPQQTKIKNYRRERRNIRRLVRRKRRKDQLAGYAFQIHHPVALVHRLCYFLSGMRLALFEDHYSRVQHKCVHDYQGQ